MIIAVYNNNYSYDILMAYLIKNHINVSRNVLFVSLGIKNLHKLEHKNCISITKYIDFIVTIFKFKKILINENIREIIVPNTNNIFTGFLHSFAIKKNIPINVCAEGTRNYHHRPVFYLEIFKRLIKFVISKLFFFEYKLHFKDDFYTFSEKSFLIVNLKKNICSSQKSIYYVFLKKINVVKPSKKILFIGGHLLDNGLKISDDDQQKLKRFLENHSDLKIFYLPHPRANKKGFNEVSILKKITKFNIIDTDLSAEDFIQLNQPTIVIAIGGSSLYLRLNTNKIKTYIAFSKSILSYRKLSFYKEIFDLHLMNNTLII